MNNELKTYLITYRDGSTQTVTGNVKLFSTETNTDVVRFSNVIYLNASDVRTIQEQPKN